MTQSKKDSRQRVRYAIRKKVSGTSERPRLAIFRSNNEIYAQIIDDINSNTLASASSKDVMRWLPTTPSRPQISKACSR